MSTDRETALYAKALEQRDAALKVLRPFARLGLEHRAAGTNPEKWIASWPRQTGYSIQVRDCLAALEFWQSHRPGVEP